MNIVASCYCGNLLVVQIDDLLCVLHKWGSVRSEEELIISDSDNQRTRFSRCHNLVRIAFLYHSYGVCADSLSQSQLHSFREIHVVLFLHVFNKLHKHFGVCVALELISTLYQVFFDYSVILYDSVMDYRKRLRLRIVRMGIAVIWLAMRRPSCVGYSYSSAQVFVRSVLLKILDFAFCLIDIYLVLVIYKSNSR